jgi:hypothetical protein
MPDPNATPVPASRTDLPRKAAPAPGIPGKPPMSTGKKAGIAVAVFFGAIFVLGGIGAAVEKAKKEKAAQGAEAAQPAATASTSQLPAPSSASPAAQPTGPANLAALEKQMEEARRLLGIESEKSGCFRLQGKINDHSDNALSLWGYAVPNPPIQGMRHNQFGAVLEEGNIVVKDYDKNLINNGYYTGLAYYLESKHGKNAVGGKVPINIYGQAPKSLAKVMDNFNRAQEAFIQANTQAQAATEKAAMAAKAAGTTPTTPAPITVSALLTAMPYLADYAGGRQEHGEKTPRTKEWWGHSWKHTEGDTEVKVGISSYADTGTYRMGFVMAMSKSGGNGYTSALTPLVDMICVFAGRSDDQFKKQTLDMVQRQCETNSSDMIAFSMGSMSVTVPGKNVAGPIFNASVEVK